MTGGQAFTGNWHDLFSTDGDFGLQAAYCHS